MEEAKFLLKLGIVRPADARMFRVSGLLASRVDRVSALQAHLPCARLLTSNKTLACSDHVTGWK